MPFPFRLKRSQHYNVANKDLFVIPIELLTNECIECTLFSTSIGQDALNNVAQKINLQQPEYFGLLFKSRKNVDQWVDLTRPLKKQLDKYAIEVRLYFRLQYFVPNFQFLSDEASRYHYFCAMKGLVIEGRIGCSCEDAVKLASLSLQAEFGDYTPERHTVEYLTNFALFPKAIITTKYDLDRLIECAINGYRNLQGLSTSVAEMFYISEAQQRDGSGQEGFPAKDLEFGHDVCLGVCIRGIFVVNTETNTVDLFKWMDIANLIHHKKVFTIERNADNYRKNYSTFDSDYASCIWRTCVEQHQYFMKGIQTLNDMSEQQQQNILQNNTTNPQNLHNLQPLCFMPNSAELFAQLQSQQQQKITSGPPAPKQEHQTYQLTSSSLQAINSLHQHTFAQQQQQSHQQSQQQKSSHNPQLTHQMPFYDTVDSSLSHHISPGPIQKSQSLIENVNMDLALQSVSRPRTSTEPPIELSQINLQESELNNNASYVAYGEQEQNSNGSFNSTPIYENAPNGAELSFEQRKALLPSYRAPPDYETFLRQRQRFHSNNNNNNNNSNNSNNINNSTNNLNQNPNITSNAVVLAAQRAEYLSLSQSLSSIPTRLAGHNQNHINSASSSSSLAIGHTQAPGFLSQANGRGPQHGNGHPKWKQQQQQQNFQQNHQNPQQVSHPQNQSFGNYNTESSQQQNPQNLPQQQHNPKFYPSIYTNYNDLSLLNSHNSGSVNDLPKPEMMFTASSPELNNLLQKRLASQANEKSVHFRTPEPSLNHESNLRKSKLQSAFASVPDLTFSNRHVLENIYENPGDYHPLPAEKSSKMLRRFNLFNNLRLLGSHANARAGSEPNLFNSKANSKLSSEHLAGNDHLSGGNVYSPAQQQQHQHQIPLPAPPNVNHHSSSHQAPPSSLQQQHAFANHAHSSQVPQTHLSQNPPMNRLSNNFPPSSHSQAIYANVNGANPGMGNAHLGGSYGQLTGQGSAPPTQPPPPPPGSSGNQQFSQHFQQQQPPQHSLHPSSQFQHQQQMQSSATALLHQQQQQHHQQNQNQQQQHPSQVSLTTGSNNVNNMQNQAQQSSTIIAISTSGGDALSRNSNANNINSNAIRYTQAAGSSSIARTIAMNEHLLPSINDHLLAQQQQQNNSNNNSIPMSNSSSSSLALAHSNDNNNTSSSTNSSGMGAGNKSNFRFPSNSRLIIFDKQGVADHEFTREFELLPRMNPIAKFTTASLPENILKNRFRDILPYEENRVKLTPTKDNKHGYINASHVKMAFDGGITQHYIAAQGPLPHTTLDFWQMVWEKSINLIVMVTNFTESGAPKCFTYLPLCNDAGKSVARFGDFEITCNYTTISPTYITSYLTVSHGSEKRSDIRHIRYTDWNDHSIPGDLQGFLSFLSEMDSIYRGSTRGGSGFGKGKKSSSNLLPAGPPPILVHCSAGAGRSGVVILCDALLKYLDHNLHEPIDIPKALIQLRFQRMISVQHCEQFRFICQVLSQHLTNTRLI